MRLKWSGEHSIHLPEIDAEHRNIYRLTAEFNSAVAKSAPPAQIAGCLRALLAEVEDHFTHEERMMRAARYQLFDWHKRQHDNMRRRAVEFAGRIQDGDAHARKEFIGYVGRWLQDHMAVADNMMGAAIRNHQRLHAA